MIFAWLIGNQMQNIQSRSFHLPSQIQIFASSLSPQKVLPNNNVVICSCKRINQKSTNQISNSDNLNGGQYSPILINLIYKTQISLTFQQQNSRIGKMTQNSNNQYDNVPASTPYEDGGTAQGKMLQITLDATKLVQFLSSHQLNQQSYPEVVFKNWACIKRQTYDKLKQAQSKKSNNLKSLYDEHNRLKAQNERLQNQNRQLNKLMKDQIELNIKQKKDEDTFKDLIYKLQVINSKQNQKLVSDKLALQDRENIFKEISFDRDNLHQKNDQLNEKLCKKNAKIKALQQQLLEMKKQKCYYQDKCHQFQYIISEEIPQNRKIAVKTYQKVEDIHHQFLYVQKRKKQIKSRNNPHFLPSIQNINRVYQKSNS